MHVGGDSKGIARLAVSVQQGSKRPGRGSVFEKDGTVGREV